jgi:uncharacterized membrane protein YraQ (UPF0718 family)
MKKVRGDIVGVVAFSLFGVGAIFSFVEDIALGKEMAANAWLFSKELLIILPLTFVLIGLFEVWVKKEVIERHLGAEAGMKSYVWAVLMGGTVVGPALVALPVAFALQKKGASITVCLIYIGSATVCRIPMTVFEVGFLGVWFTVIRYSIAIPLVVCSAIVLGRILERQHYQLQEVQRNRR